MLTKSTKWVVLLAIGALPIKTIGQEIADKHRADEINAKQTQDETNTIAGSTYRLETSGSYSSGENTPFWLINHTWGIVPLDAPNGYMKAGVFHTHTIKNKLAYEIGLDIAGSSKQSNRNSYWIQQAYGGIKWKSLALRAGSKEQYGAIIENSKLSSGDMVYSNNVRPNPEISISIPQYTLVPFTKNRLYAKVDFAIGQFLDGDYLEKTAVNLKQRYAKNPLTHHKSLFLRLGNIEWQEKGFQWIVGFNDYVTWSEKNYIIQNGEYRELYTSSSNFFKTLFPIYQYGSGSRSSSYNFRIDYGKDYADQVFSIYWQHPMKTRSDFQMKNYRDMRLGIEYKSLRHKTLSGFVFEYIFTKQQGGSFKSDYYNQTSARQGNSYYGRTIGNPLLLSPEYNKDGYIGYRSNRIFALHTGVEGYLNNQFQYNLLATYGDTRGSFVSPYTPLRTGFASSFDVTYYYPKAKGLSLKCAVAYNAGRFFGPNAIGGELTIRKTGKLF
jgi:Capsule assembly protein Wzi